MVSVARAVLKTEMLKTSLMNIGTGVATSTTENTAWDSALFGMRLLTCVFSVWELISSKENSPRKRQSTVAAKKAKLAAQLKGGALLANLTVYMDQWVKTRDAFSKAD